MDMKLFFLIGTSILWTYVRGGDKYELEFSLLSSSCDVDAAPLGEPHVNEEPECAVDEDCDGEGGPQRKKRGIPVDTPYCETFFGECVECLIDAACADVHPDRPFCQRGSLTCVECLEDSNCNEPTPFCMAGECRPECMDANDCEDNEKCNTTRGLCVCENDDDPCNDDDESCDEDGNCSCDDGFVRESENSDFCIPDCNPPCGPGEVCRRDRKCECGPSTVRDPSGDCVPCQPDCSTNADCKNEGEVCNTKFECECPSGEKLFSGKCVGSGRLGGWCKTGGRCFGRMLKCNRSTNMCLCRGRHCEARTVCVKTRK